MNTNHQTWDRWTWFVYGKLNEKSILLLYVYCWYSPKFFSILFMIWVTYSKSLISYLIESSFQYKRMAIKEKLIVIARWKNMFVSWLVLTLWDICSISMQRILRKKEKEKRKNIQFPASWKHATLQNILKN